MPQRFVDAGVALPLAGGIMRKYGLDAGKYHSMRGTTDLGRPSSRLVAALLFSMAASAACSASRPPTDRAGAEPTAQSPALPDTGSPPVEPVAADGEEQLTGRDRA